MNVGDQIQFISDCDGGDLIEMIQKSIDHGACACYIQGSVVDKLVEKEDFDTMDLTLEQIGAFWTKRSSTRD